MCLIFGLGWLVFWLAARVVGGQVCSSASCRVDLSPAFSFPRRSCIERVGRLREREGEIETERLESE